MNMNERFEVGDTVRVTKPCSETRGSLCKGRGIIAAIEEGKSNSLNSTQPSLFYEIILSDGSEITVPEKSVEPVQPFEKDCEVEGLSFLELKEQGSDLYRLRDYEAAAEKYNLALEGLKPSQSLSVGSTVVAWISAEPVHLDGKDSFKTSYKSGMVSDLDSESKTCDLLVDGGDDDEELIGISWGQVAMISDTEPTEQCAITLNLARCHLQQEQYTEARSACLAVLALGNYLCRAPGHDRQRVHSFLRSAYLLRARTHLNQNHLAQAKKDAIMASRLPSTQASKTEIERLLQQIKKRSAVLQQKNKRLAKDIAQWVETAMESSSQYTS